MLHGHHLKELLRPDGFPHHSCIMSLQFLLEHHELGVLEDSLSDAPVQLVLGGPPVCVHAGDVLGGEVADGLRDDLLQLCPDLSLEGEVLLGEAFEEGGHVDGFELGVLGLDHILDSCEELWGHEVSGDIGSVDSADLLGFELLEILKNGRL